MSLTPPVTAAASRMWRRPVRIAARLLFWLVMAAVSLGLIAWLTLHWGILPHIEQWRPAIEARASQALGVPVRIGGITVRSSGWVPSFELREVELLDAQQRSALRLPRVAAALSPRSLLGGQLNFAQLLIEGAQLDVRRDREGHLFVGGLQLAQTDGDGAAADWFFRQREIVVRGGSLRWTDEQRSAPPVALSEVQLVVRNRLRSHELRLDATPEAAWGDRFSATAEFTQPLFARRGDWHRWSGTVHANLPRADLRTLHDHVELPFELSEGDGALRGWLDVKDGTPKAATLDVALRAVTLRLHPSVQPMRFAQVEGRIVGEHDAEHTMLAAQRLSFVTGDGIRWPQGDISMRWRQRPGEASTGGEFSAGRLDVGVMAQVAARVPLGAALRRLLGELKPSGVVTDLKARWDGPLDAPQKYQADAVLSGLTFAAKPSSEARGIGRPGLRNAAMRLSATEAGGQAQLDMKAGAIEFPGVFEEPLIPIDQMKAKLLWQIEPVAGAAPKVSLTVKGASFANADTQGEVNASWRTGAGSGVGHGGRYPGVLELDGKLGRGQAARTARYLALGIPAAARHYVAHAVRGGRVASASFRVKGDLWDFPYLDPREVGEFRITAVAEDVALDYVPSLPATPTSPAFVSTWLPFSGVSGELVIDRASLSIRNARGRLGALQLTQVQGGIANFADRAVLSIGGDAAGPLADMLHYVKATPVGGLIDHALDEARGSGNADLKLALNIPLDDLEATTVKGALTLPGNDVHLVPDRLPLDAARGRVDFTERGVKVIGASAGVLGGELVFDGGTNADGTLHFAGHGTATAEGIRRIAEAGPQARLAATLSGQAAYRLNIDLDHGRPDVTVTSNLVGLAAELPAPLHKAAETALALRFQTRTTAPAKAGAAATQDSLQIDLGNLLQAAYVRDVTGDTPRVLRGGIGLGAAAPTPDEGVAANLAFDSLNTDAWSAFTSRIRGPGAADGGSEADPTAGYLPRSIALRAQELIAGPRRLSKVVLGLSEVDGLWRANVDADQFNGYVEYRPARRGESAAAAGRVYARLSRLSLPKSDVEQVETLLDEQPASVPSLDIVVNDLELRGKHIGRVEIEALNQPGGEAKDGPREWRLSKFNVANPEAQLTATGHWLAGATPSAKRRAVLDFKLALADSGALLDRLGQPKALRGGKGQMAGQVTWLGSPLTPDYASMSGQLNVAIDSGQFLKVDPGATRLLSVLSLQALPRRLLLDFRDVFQDGFSFDNITGDVTIAQGVARTNNLRMRGLQAAVLMDGSADVARETQALRVIVVPEVNAGTASLAYAVINPVIGLGTFLAQLFLRKPLAEAGTREFRISGPWSDPKVVRVERQGGEVPPDLDATPPTEPAGAPTKP